MYTDKCAICGRFREEHHEFVGEKDVPAGCRCSGEWEGEITPICSTYEASDSKNPTWQRLCRHCEHDPECHVSTKSER